MATDAERGNWILPADVEHLQRTIVKLHELLIRKGVGNSNGTWGPGQVQ
jgi:hypothetical protein